MEPSCIVGMTLAVIMGEAFWGEVHFFAKHDDRKGHPYYTRLSRPVEPSCIVGMTLAVIMGEAFCKKMKRTLPSILFR